MSEVIGVCSNDIPHTDWPRLATLDYDDDVSALAAWIPNVFERQPAPFPIQGLWIGLCNPRNGNKVWADMYVGSVARYAPDDNDFSWLWKSERHYPENAYATSSSLRKIYEIGYGGENRLGNNAEWPLCLAFGAFAVRSLLRDQNPQLVASTAPQIGVVVGFDSGDMLKIGELTQRGFAMSSKT